MTITGPGRRSWPMLVGVILGVGLSSTIASAHRPGTLLPIARLKIQTTQGGEPVDIDLREGGDVFLRVAPQKEGRLAARVVGSKLIASDGRVLATLRPGGILTVFNFGKRMQLRGCVLIDERGTEFGLTPNGDLWSKARGQPRFSLPAGVQGDFMRACPTAVLLYWMLPFLGQVSG